MREYGISIHAPRTGSDALRQGAHIEVEVFQSTLPARGATLLLFVHHLYRVISIHAPRTGSDTAQHPDTPAEGTFQSTLPARGATASRRQSRQSRQQFQSTLPARGATMRWNSSCIMARISIHAPRTGSDVSVWARRYWTANFNPRSPHGERLYRAFPGANRKAISIHAPRTGSDCIWRCDPLPSKFQSTLPARGATVIWVNV